MRTSATGRADHRRRAGFTLVELLVVVTILALTSAFVVLSLPPSQPSVAAEAEHFAARLVRAREEAVLTNHPVEVRVDAKGYGFRKRFRGEWRPLEERPFQRMAWETGTVAVTEPEGEPGIGFDVIGYAAPATLSLTRDDQRARVMVDSAGEVRVDASAR